MDETTKRRILFVDDEPMVLKGLQRTLRKMRNDWEMAFASSSKEALDILEAEPYDVIVSDLRMPDMDGAQLLAEVKSRHRRWYGSSFQVRWNRKRHLNPCSWRIKAFQSPVMLTY